MLIFPSAQFRKRHGHGKPATAPPGPAALTLVAAEFLDGPEYVNLTFDRAVSIAAIDGSQILLDGGADTGLLYNGVTGAAMLDPVTVQVYLHDIGSSSGSDVTLTASAATGIVAVDDGGTWAGVTALVLPFP